MSNDDGIAAVLSTNIGFNDPTVWLHYARKHGFRSVKAFKVAACPNCDCDGGSKLGQYIYYSTLFQLIDCSQCGLIWADARLNELTTQQHFEGAYKGEDYFRARRADIFAQLASLASGCSRQGASVLDVGGATGHLLELLSKQRPDLQLTLNDISENACNAAAARLGVNTQCGDLDSLVDQASTYDTVICSDVIYYDPNIGRLWQTLESLVRPGGTLILRVPNKLWPIRSVSAVHRLLPASLRKTQDRVAFFNPEHLYVLRRRYIEEQLHAHGFANVVVLPARMLRTFSSVMMLERIGFALANFMYMASSRRAVLTPSMIITAVRKT